MIDNPLLPVMIIAAIMSVVAFVDWLGRRKHRHSKRSIQLTFRISCATRASSIRIASSSF